MNIADTKNTQITPEQMREEEKARRAESDLKIQKKQEQKFYDSLSETGKIKTQTNIYKSENIKLKSPVTSAVGSQAIKTAIDTQYNATQAFLDKNNSPVFNVTNDQFKVISNMLSMTDDMDGLKNELEPAIALSNTLGLPLDFTMKNKELLAAQYGMSRFIQDGTFSDKIKQSLVIGQLGVNSSKLGKELKIINSKLANTTDEEEIKSLEKELAELQKRIDASDNYIYGHQVAFDDGLLKNLAYMTAQQIPLIAKTTGKGLLYMGLTSAVLGLTISGGWAAPAIAASFSGGASAGAATLAGLANANSFTTAVGIITASGLAGNFQSMKDVTTDMKYLELSQNGVEHDKAVWTSEVLGNFTAVTETALGGLSNQVLSGFIGTKAGGKIFSEALQKIVLDNGKATKLLISAVDVLSDPLSEGATEFTQTLFESWLDTVAYKDVDGVSEELKVLNRNDFEEAIGSLVAGVGVAGLLRLPHIIGDVKMTLNQYNQVMETIKKNPNSKEWAITQIRENVSEDLNENLISKIYDRVYEGSEQEQVGMPSHWELNLDDDVDIEFDKEGFPITTTIEPTDVKSARISEIQETSNLVGSYNRKLPIVNGANEEIGNIDITAENNKLNIKDITVAEGVDIVPLIQQVIKTNPNMEVVLETNNDPVLESIADELAQLNPRGEEFGLAYYEIETENIDLIKKIQEPFNMTPEKASVSVALIDLMAKSNGYKNAQEWWSKNIKDILPLDSSDFKGKISFDNKRMEAVIYTAQNADVTTFTHETFHLVLRQSDTKGELATKINSWATNNEEEFRQFFKENKGLFETTNIDKIVNTAKNLKSGKNKGWTIAEEELAASLFEGWLKGGRSKNKELNNILSKMNDWFKQVYYSLKGTVKLNDEIASYFDNLYGTKKEQTVESAETTKKTAQPVQVVKKKKAVKKVVKKKVQPTTKTPLDDTKLNMDLVNAINRDTKLSEQIKELRKRSTELSARMVGATNTTDRVKFAGELQSISKRIKDLEFEKLISKGNIENIQKKIDEKTLNDMPEKDAVELMQKNNKEQIREQAVQQAMQYSDTQAFIDYRTAFYKNEVHKYSWYESVFKEATERVNALTIQNLYSTSTIEQKNNIFKRSLQRDDVSNSFARKIRDFRKSFSNRKDTASADYSIKKELLNEIEETFSDNFLNTSRISGNLRGEIKDLAEENPSAIRTMFAKLYGQDYMMDITEYDNTDYLEVFMFNEDELDNKIVNAMVSTNVDEAKRVMVENYKLVQTNQEKQVNNLKDKIAKLEKERDKAISTLRKTKKFNIEEEQKIRKEYREKIKKLRDDYKAELEKAYNTNRIYKIKNAKIDTSIRADYANNIRALQLLLTKPSKKGQGTRDKFRGVHGEEWSPELIQKILIDTIGVGVIDKMTIEDIEKISNEKLLASKDDLILIQSAISQLKQKGKLAKRLEMSEFASKTNKDLKTLLKQIDISSNDIDNNKYQNFLLKHPLIFSSFMNIVRKAAFLDGAFSKDGKTGAFTRILVDMARANRDLETKAINARMTKVSNIMAENGIKSPLEYSEIVFSTKFGDTEYNFSKMDLILYDLAYDNSNSRAAYGGSLLNPKEQINYDLEKETFEGNLERLANERYNIVRAEANKYKSDQAFVNIENAISDAFKNEAFARNQELILKYENRLIKAEKDYIPIYRIDAQTIDALSSTHMAGDQSMNERGYSTTKNGHLISRVKVPYSEQTKLNTNAYDVLLRTITQQEHLNANYEYVRELNQIFGGKSKDSKNLRKAIINNYGHQMMDDITSFIEETANPYAFKQEDALSKVVMPLRGKIYPAFLAGRIPVVVMQFITSPAAFIAKMNPLQYLGSLIHTFGHRKEVISEINELSPFMRNRTWDYVWADIIRQRNSVGTPKTKAGVKMEMVTESMMGWLQFADTMTVYSGWKQMYDTKLAELGPPTDANIKQAAKYADDFVRNTQPHSEVAEIAPIFKSSSAAKVFTQFTASLSPIFQNLAFDTVANFSQGNNREAVGMILGYMMAGAILFAVRGGYEDDDDMADTCLKFLYSTLSQPVSSLPLIGNIMDYYVQEALTGEKRGLYSTSLFPAFDKFMQGVGKLELDSPEAFKENIGKSISLVTQGFMIYKGMPQGFFKDADDFVSKVLEGKPADAFFNEILGQDR